MEADSTHNMMQRICKVCDYSVKQSPEAKRTICPQCGNFYSGSHAENPPEPRRRIRNCKTDNRVLAKTHPTPGTSIISEVG